MPRVLLASRSPRRRLLLDEAGIEHEVIDSGVDDSQLRPGAAGAEHWVMALAYLKAAAARSRLRGSDGCDGGHAVVLGADTVVVDDGEIIGQPRDRADAERILRRLIGGEHDVLTGVAMVEACARPGSPAKRELMFDAAHVRVGPVTEEQLGAYLDSGEWRGKAGAYNLSERLAAGWPIEVHGDAGTVMGLPVGWVRGRLETWMGQGGSSICH